MEEGACGETPKEEEKGIVVYGGAQDILYIWAASFAIDGKYSALCTEGHAGLHTLPFKNFGTKLYL